MWHARPVLLPRPPSQATTLGRASEQGSVGAEDQSSRPGHNTSGDQTLQRESIPTSLPPRVGLFTGAGKALLDLGIDIHRIVLDHLIATPSAGVVLGQVTNVAVLRPAVDSDLGKLFSLMGGNLHLDLAFDGLQRDIPQILSQTGGILTGFQTTPITETHIPSVLTYEQRLLSDKLSLEAGRTNVYN